MKKPLISSLAVMFATSLFAGGTFEVIEKEFDAEGINKIEIEADSADMDFAGADVKKITVKVVRFEEDKCILDIVPKVNKLFIELKNKRKYFVTSGSFCKADIEITSPANISYEVDGGSSDIKGANITAQTHVDTGSGDIDLINVSGSVYARTGSGEVDVANVAGETTIKTGSGNIRMAEVIGPVMASTGSGDIEGVVESRDVVVATGSGETRLSGLTGSLRHTSGSGSLTAAWGKPVTEGKLSLKLGSGDADLCFPKGSKINVDFYSGSGKVKNELGFLPEHRFLIYAKTGSGDLHISYCR
jgi:DUF4097 and DUF4098 domain-containing protein YvlB